MGEWPFKEEIDEGQEGKFVPHSHSTVVCKGRGMGGGVGGSEPAEGS